MNCKICGEDLYSEILFSNMFKLNYEIHRKCNNNLSFNLEEEVIPIESNIIIYDYVFSELLGKYNEEYLWTKYISILFVKHIKNKDWSMLVFYDDVVEYFLNNYNPYLLINLSNNPILIISLIKMNSFYLEQI